MIDRLETLDAKLGARRGGSAQAAPSPLSRLEAGLRRRTRGIARGIGPGTDLLRRNARDEVALFHDLAPPPGGGGNQFLRALERELAERGVRVGSNRISPTTRACLFNSFNFDVARLRRQVRPGCRMVHRVDGPVTVYRGSDDGTDGLIAAMNHELADATIFQSRYSLELHAALGLELVDPVVIPNAVDPRIFNQDNRREFSAARQTRIIASSWSTNPNKGADVLRGLEHSLDWSRFDFTFVGRADVTFERARVVPPVDSETLAALLREHDIFLTASRHEACSNAVLEALACGLPVLYVDSGSHGELVGEAGMSFSEAPEIPAALDRMVAAYEELQARISIRSLEEVADRYLEALGCRT